MDNQINNIFTLGNDEKYLVLNQAVYQGNNYYYVVKVTDDEENIVEEYNLLEEREQDGQKSVRLVQDKSMIELLAKYLTPRD